jgi:eukaryotic-like serine/threonine-protein kinase
MSMIAIDTPSVRDPLAILRDPLPGTGYCALRRLGGGTTSEVYEALAPGGARCAVKVLRPMFAALPDAVFRMELEVRALAALDHPSLVPVLDAGTTATGRSFFVMPLLEGETLRDRIARDGPMTPVEACAIAADVLAGLDAAHRAGVVHRDVKPANVFLSPSRPGAPARARVLDFGLAKLLEAPAGLTTETHVVGTPRYLSPEQILAGHVDARTDVYTAGLVILEMIAGRGPFAAVSPIQLMRAHVQDPPLRLRACVRVSTELDQAVARAVAKPPARRWPSARAFAEVLARAAERERGRTGAGTACGADRTVGS